MNGLLKWQKATISVPFFMEIPWEYQIKKQDKQLLQLLIDAILYYGHMKHKKLYNML